MFHSRFNQYGLWSQMGLISDPNSANFLPCDLGQDNFPLPSLSSLIYTAGKRTPASFDCCEDDRKKYDGAWPARDARCSVKVSSRPPLSVLNLFPCCVQLKVYDVLKVIFQFRSNKL